MKTAAPKYRRHDWFSFFSFSVFLFALTCLTNTGRAQGLPTPWQTQDVGAVGATGSASYSAGTFTIVGSGADIYGTADEFRFVYQQITGDCTIIARVASVQQIGAWSKGGIMIRDDLTAGAKNATVVVTANGGNSVQFQQRTTANQATTQTQVTGVNAPQWVRLVRTGNSFAASYSANGTTWTAIGTAQTITLSATAYVGLVVDSFVDGSLCTSTFDNVSATDNVAPTVSITAPTNGATVSGAAVTVTANASDNVGVVGVQFKLDGANLGTEDTTSPYSINWDSTTATNTSHSLTAVARDAAGNTTTSTAVSVTVNNALPTPWQTQDVGAVGATGNASYSAGTFTVVGSGADIFGTADEFRFVYQQITGDCTLVARVASVQQVGAWSKGGIMIRDDLTAGAKNATVVVTANGGNSVQFQQRTTANQATTQTQVTGVNAPEWVRLVRVGNSFTASYSANGTSWTTIGTAQTITLNSTVYVGLVVDSFVDGSLCTSTFDNVSVTDTAAPTVSITAPTSGATVSGTAVTVSATASDNVGVVGVQFKLDGANLGAEDTTSPYTVSWNSTTATNASHSLTAVARDAAGNATTSAAVSVTVDNAAPTVSITAPASGASVSGTAVTVSANASDNVSVVGVQFKLDGANLGTEDTTSPYSVSWNSTTATNASHSLTAVARDAAGNTTTATAITVTVDNVAPTVSITAPTNGATVSGSSVAVSATASDNVGVVGVQFKLDGANLGAEDTTSPYSVSWDSTTATNAGHSLTAVARDAAGNTTTATTVSVTVNNSGSLPAPWQTQDVGAVGATGSASYSSGTFTVIGSGADIYGTADEFRFVYQQITGDCTLVARVASVQQVGAWSKGGIMIRDDLTAGAKNAAVIVTANGGNSVQFQQRITANQATTQTQVAGVNAPQWVRLVRIGNSFTASYSANGTSWTAIGTAQTIALNSTVYVGLVVDSFVDGSLCTSTFDNVSVTTGSYSYAQDFSSNAIGWSPVSGTWAWNSAAANYNASTESGTSIAVYGNLTWTTGYTYSAAIGSPQSGAGDLIGLVYNYVDQNNYYLLSLKPSGVAELWKVISGASSLVASSTWTFPGTNVLFDVDIVRGTGTTTVKINGTTIFNAVAQSDAQIGAGKIGFYANGNLPQFDDVTVIGTATAIPAYYVDATGGLDTNNGRSPAAAWKTIGKVNSSTFTADDLVLFKCGETWNEQLTIPSSGTTGHPIRFGAYGSGAKPMIDTTLPVSSGWTVYSGNIWVVNIGYAVNQVFVDGGYQPVAHYPNSGWLTTTSSSANETYIIDSNHPTGDLVGADIRVWSQEWSIDEATISSVSGSQLNINSSGGQGYGTSSGARYAVANKLWMLDSAGEWYYDSTTGKLYLWMPDGTTPNGKNVRASRYPYGIYATGKRQITIEDLAINGAYNLGVRFDDTTEFIVQRLTLTNLGALRCLNIIEAYNGTGIGVFRNSTLSTELGLISNNTIHNVLHTGVFDYQLSNLTVADNAIDQIGTIGWSNYLPCAGTGISLLYSCANAIIEHNTVNDVSWSGIYFNSNNNLVLENIVQRVMTLLADGAAIYCAGTNTDNSIVRHNVLLNVRDTKAYGVYCDEKAEYVTAELNTIGNMPYGTMNHKGRYNTFQDNIIYGVLHDAVEIQEDTGSPYLGYSTGNVYQRNTYFSKAAIPMVYLSNWRTDGSTFNFGTYNNNTFSSLDSTHVIKTSNSSATTYYTLASWHAVLSTNEDSSRFVAQVGSANPNDDSIFLVNATGAPQTFQFANYGTAGRTYTDLNGTAVSWPITLQPYNSAILLWSGH